MAGSFMGWVGWYGGGLCNGGWFDEEAGWMVRVKEG